MMTLERQLAALQTAHRRQARKLVAVRSLWLAILAGLALLYVDLFLQLGDPTRLWLELGVGASLLRKFKVAPEPEPDPAQLRPVEVEFRCTICGTTVVMTTAAGDEPEPPRHCREDMVRV